MPRRFRPLTFDRLDALPVQCAACAYWESAEQSSTVCAEVCDPELIERWYATVGDEWGDPGRVATEDDHVLGFIKYAPARYFPRTRDLPGRPDPDVPLITCMHIADDARRKGVGGVLLQSALHDLRSRGARAVLAYGCAFPTDMSTMPVVGMEFLLRNGFTVETPDRRFPLMRVDLRATLPWAENLEAVLESLRLPIRAPRRVPTTFHGPE